jgi:hypothetical protein
MFARGIPFVLLLVSSSAMAFDTTKLGQFGSLGLDEMMSLIDKSPQLKREVTDAVAKTKVKGDEICRIDARQRTVPSVPKSVL